MSRAGPRRVEAASAESAWRRRVQLLVWVAGYAACCAASPAAAGDIKVWPLVDYHRDREGVQIDLLGPLLSYRRSAEESLLAFRPLFHWRGAAGAARPRRNELSILYPLAIARWDEERSNTRILGLFAWQTEPRSPEAEWERRFTLFPFVFYRHHQDRGGSLSVLPFYADLQGLFGFQRIQAVGFPLYLRLDEGLSHRSWLLFPFFSWSGGQTGRGWRVWPLYGWQENGEAVRSRFVLWPFYIREERHPFRLEREVRFVSFPFYSRIDGPTLRSWAVLGIGITHSVDLKARTDSWGFPWPFWLVQRDLDTGRTLTVRAAPFYQDRRQGDLHSQFFLWPAYRHEVQEVEGYRHERSDALLVLWRRITETGGDSGRSGYRHTLFPLWRIEESPTDSSGQTASLLDALAPTNEVVREVYSPLWRLYGYGQTAGGQPQWSIAWNFVSAAGDMKRYPIHLRFDD